MKKMTIVLITLILITVPQVFAETKNASSLQELPPYYNWRDIDGVDYTTPVKDQSPAPTCETYALCAVLETLMQYQEGELFEPDLSETHLYFYAGGTYDAGGVNLQDAADYLVEYGVPDEGCYPDPHRPYDYPFESLPGWENRTVKIPGWGWVEKDDEAIKQALIDHGPLVICISVYTNFMQYCGGIYDTIEGDREGGHLVACTDGHYRMVLSASTTFWPGSGRSKVMLKHHQFWRVTSTMKDQTVPLVSVTSWQSSLDSKDNHTHMVRQSHVNIHETLTLIGKNRAIITW